MLYSKLAETYELLEKTPAKLKKTEIIAGLLEETGAKDLRIVVSLLQGRVFPVWAEEEIGIASLLMIKILSNSLGISVSQVENKFKKIGDLGLVAEEFAGSRKQATLLSRKLAVQKVFENLQKLAYIEGKGSQDIKFQLVSELLANASPKEAKYIVRTAIGDLRVGVAEGMIRDAIAKAYFSDVIWDGKRIEDILRVSGNVFLVEKGYLDRLEEKKKLSENDIAKFKQKNKIIEKYLQEIKKSDLWKMKTNTDCIILSDSDIGNSLKKRILSAVEWAWFLRPDYGEVAEIAKEQGLEGLEKVKLKIGEPYNVLLAEKSPTLEEALKEYENTAIEVKYDGARVSCHKKGDKIWLYTRRLENVTKQFPDLVELAKKNVKSDNCIIEGEILGIDPKTGNPRPFQVLSQRIHRKYDIEQIMKEIPIQVNFFDIVYLDGEMLFDNPMKERRALLEKVIKTADGKFQLAEQLVTKDLKKAESFYEQALENNQEGVMVKNLDARYVPGRRVAGGWLKVKPTLETLDLAIIGAVWGTGKRAGWFGSFILGCLGKEGDVLECGMMGTGIKEKKTKEGDVTLLELTKMLKPLVTKSDSSGVKIRPKIIVEVAYEEIQKSPNYSSGYALRFPRFLRLRPDKKEPDGIERVEKIFAMQKGKRGGG